MASNLVLQSLLGANESAMYRSCKMYFAVVIFAYLVDYLNFDDWKRFALES